MFDIKRSMQRVGKEEAGITALETAIILIAFVVVASVFAFTVLSAGAFSTERGKEAVYAGLSQVRSSMELTGSVIATATVTGTAGTVDGLVFTVGNAMGGEAINLSTTDKVVTVEYRDALQRKSISDWSISWKVRNDTDDLLEGGELVEIAVPIDDLDTPLGVNTEFAVEIMPPTGAVLNIQRTTPAYMELVYDLQ
jgi:flagellin FlaB